LADWPYLGLCSLEHTATWPICWSSVGWHGCHFYESVCLLDCADGPGHGRNSLDVAESNHRSECHSELLGPLLWGKTKRFLDGRNIPVTFGVA
jgi:hypothetical protein